MHRSLRSPGRTALGGRLLLGLSAALLLTPFLGNVAPVHAAAADCSWTPTIHDCAAPDPVSVSAQARDSSSILVRWQEHNGSDPGQLNINIQREGVAQPSITGSINFRPAVDGNGFTTTVAALDFNTTYCFELQTVSLDNQLSPWSDPACATTPNPPLFPSGAPLTIPDHGDLPAALTVQPSSSTALTLNWSYADHGAEFTGFTIYRDGKVAGSVAAAAGAGYQFTDSGLVAPHSYLYTVCANYRDGDIQLPDHCSAPVRGWLFTLSASDLSAASAIGQLGGATPLGH
jgi:hypothetical protein